LIALALGLLGGACRQVSTLDNFPLPYEHDEILMPQSTRSYVLAAPRGTTVDIGLDFDDQGSRTGRVQLMVASRTGPRLGAEVPGSQMKQAVCEVALTPDGVQVNVQNLSAIRSASYAIRIERSPSNLCQPRQVIPSTATVRREDAPRRDRTTL
jgi:hypothetical protein